MEQEDKNAIYDRLLSINVKLDPASAPDPVYINGRICECHRYVEEVEAYFIKIIREISVLQQARNNVSAEYQSKKDAHFELHDVVILPNIRDREASANRLLKDELRKIKEYDNSLGDLNNLLGAIKLKLKNLSTVNGDVRSQIRIMEAQIKLSVGPKGDPVIADLAREMSRGASGDAFVGATTSVDTSMSVDPTAPLDINNLLGVDDEEPLAPLNLNNIDDVDEDTAKTIEGVFVSSDPASAPDPESNGVVPDEEESEALVSSDPAPAPDPESNGVVPGEEEPIDGAWDPRVGREDGGVEEDPYELTTEEETAAKDSSPIDLDTVLENVCLDEQKINEEMPQGGAPELTPDATVTIDAVPTATNQKIEPKKSEQAKILADVLDLDNLLDTYTTTK